MYETGTTKMLVILILEILRKYSDAEHRLTQQDILRYLKLEYGAVCDRRSVKSNVECLVELGYDIDMKKGYCLLSPDFEPAELRMLIDSVLCSKNITQQQAKVLIEKLQLQGNKYFKPKVSHVCNLPTLHHGDNTQFLYALDALNDAINAGQKVSFVYNSYGTDFQLHPRRQEPYVVNPYQLVVANGFYYLIANYDKYDDISHYRLDKITQVQLLPDRAKPIKNLPGQENGLDLPRHLSEHIYMFSGASVNVQMQVPQHLMNELVDWFGKDFRIVSQQEGDMVIAVKCNRQAMVYWALQYGPYAQVLSPADLRQELAEKVGEMYQRYCASSEK